MTLVALIHATPAAMAPAREAFAAAFPAARLWNLLDDRLIGDAEAAGGLTAPLRDRMTALIRYAIGGGADAVQLSCSMYGPVAATPFPVPVLASDGALFEEVARLRPGSVAVLGPTAAGLDDSVARLAAVAAGTEITGRQATRDTVVQTVRTVAADVIVLGQFSLAPMHAAVQEVVSVPVLSAPRLAADRLRQLVGDVP